MNDILKYSALAVACAFLAAYLKQAKSELAPLASAAAGIFMVFAACTYFSPIISAVRSLGAESGVNSVYISVIFKVLATAYVATFAADICRDAEQNALASKVEMLARVMIVYFTLPLALSVFDFLAKIF